MGSNNLMGVPEFYHGRRGGEAPRCRNPTRISLADIRSSPKLALARPPPTRQTIREGRLKFLSLRYSALAANQSVRKPPTASARLKLKALDILDNSLAVKENAAAGCLTFRIARAEDLSELVRMLADDPLGSRREVWSVPVGIGYTEAFAAIEADPNNELVVGVIDEVIVGMLQLTFIPYLTYQGRWRALIEGVRVSSSVRSQGVGAAMLQWAIERARLRHCVMVQLTTDRVREEALRFYERLGFAPSHHGMKLHL